MCYGYRLSTNPHLLIWDMTCEHVVITLSLSTFLPPWTSDYRFHFFLYFQIICPAFLLFLP